MKNIIILLFLALISSTKNQKGAIYIYRIDNAIGLSSNMQVVYQGKPVGTLMDINSTKKFFYGKIKFNNNFRVKKNMLFYKIIPYIGNGFIKIETNSKSNSNVPLKDTLLIRVN